MKTYIFFILTCLLAIAIFAFNYRTQPSRKIHTSTKNKSAVSPIDGAWELVWSSSNGKDNPLKKSSQFKMFANGFFSMVAWDSAGKFSYSGYGKFELENNIYKETHLYFSDPKYVGATDWQECELKGDTLYTKAFTKVILADGQDKTADFPKIVEKRVRAK